MELSRAAMDREALLTMHQAQREQVHARHAAACDVLLRQIETAKEEAVVARQEAERAAKLHLEKLAEAERQSQAAQVLEIKSIDGQFCLIVSLISSDTHA